jgi:hypothetical protein
MPATNSQSSDRASHNIDRLVCGFSSRLRRDRGIVVLEGYVDDSGTGHGTVAVLAGFLSTADRWKAFSDALEDLCQQEPKTPKFKMNKATDFRAYHPATRQDLDKRIEDVAALIRTHAMYRVDAVVSREAYDDIVRGRVSAEIDDPYFVLFHTIILAAAHFMDAAHLEGTADFVFDEQGKIGREARDWYYFIKGNIELRIQSRMGAEPIFRDDDNVLALKSADLLAWEVRRHLAVEQPTGTAHNERLDSILAMQGVSCHVMPEHLDAFVRNFSHGLMLQAHCVHLIPPSAGSSPEQPLG